MKLTKCESNLWHNFEVILVLELVTVIDIVNVYHHLCLEVIEVLVTPLLDYIDLPRSHEQILIVACI